MFTSVDVLFAKAEPVVTFLETVIKPRRQGWKCRTAENRGITALIMEEDTAIKHIVTHKAHLKPMVSNM